MSAAASSSNSRLALAHPWYCLRRVFDTDIETGERCGAKVEVMARIEDPAVNNKILDLFKASPP